MLAIVKFNMEKAQDFLTDFQGFFLITAISQQRVGKL